MIDAGMSRETVAGSDMGVFVAASDDARYGELLPEQSTFALAGLLPSVTASRVAFAFDVHGPAMAIDAACASGLACLEQAAAAVRAGRCSSAVVAGGNVILAPVRAGAYSGAILSRDGVCRPFDAAVQRQPERAGTGAGEGVVSFVLKPLDAALRDGNHIYGELCSVVTRNVGRAASITSPSSEQQIATARQALAGAAGCSPPLLGMIEAHGTGTALGDALEWRALSHVYASHQRSARPATPLTSSKVCRLHCMHVVC
jgi:acyl transferase domain-containing protein